MNSLFDDKKDDTRIIFCSLVPVDSIGGFPGSMQELARVFRLPAMLAGIL
jgi:hypothetical protein